MNARYQDALLAGAEEILFLVDPASLAILAAIPFVTTSDFVLNLATLVLVWAIFAVGFDLVFGALGMVFFSRPDKVADKTP